MAFSEIKENVDQIHEDAKGYVESTVKYYKLWGFKVAMKSTTMILKFVLVLICFTMMLIFASIAASFAIGNAIDSVPLGFLIVSGVYFCIFIMLLFIKSRVIEGATLRRFSKIFYND